MNNVNLLSSYLDPSLFKAKKAGTDFNDLRTDAAPQRQPATALFSLEGDNDVPEEALAALAANPPTKSLSSQTLFNAQAIGQKDSQTVDQLLASKDKKNNVNKSPIEQLIEYMQMTPEQRIFKQVLGEEGMTKEEFAKLSPEDQQKIMDKVKERIKTALNADNTTVRSPKELAAAMFMEVQSVQGISASKNAQDSELRDIPAA